MAQKNFYSNKKSQADLNRHLSQSACAPQYEASPLHSDMKHYAYASYNEKIKNEKVL